MPSALAEGDLLAGRFRIARQLGQGGMGVVFLAQDGRTNVDVALKFLNPDRTSGSDISRFKREFRAAARLSHPHCVQVFELIDADDRWFYTMEYVPGGRLASSRRPPTQAAAIGLQILAALDHLHSKQIIHRDIKPQNILVEGDADAPTVKLCDFGIAKAADLAEDADVGDFVGSLRYLAPEQAERGQADVRSDLYALGVVLYELLAGRHPQPKPVPGWTVERLLASPPEPLRTAAPEVPGELADLVMQLLEKEPRRRPPAAADVFDRLDAWLSRQPSAPLRLALPPLSRKALLGSPQLVGRAPELARIGRFVEAALAPETVTAPRLLLLAGPPGLGKSRLMNQALHLGERLGANVFTATSSAEGGLPYASLAGLLRSAAEAHPQPEPPPESSSETAATFDKQTVRRSAPALTASQLAAVDVDAHSETPARSGSPAQLADDFARQAAELGRQQRELANALIETSRRKPILVLIEDVQWADQAVLQLIGLVLRLVRLAEERGTSPRLAFLLSQRPAPDHAALASLRALVLELNALEAVDLQPLSATSATELVTSMLMVESDVGVGPFAAALRDRTEGNPLFMAEVLQSLLAAGRLKRGATGWNLGPELLDGTQLPSTLAEAIGERAARFWIGTKRMLQAAAVVGSRFDLGALGAAIGLEAAQLLDCLDEAIRAGFVEEAEGEEGYRFTHERYREAILERVPLAEAAVLHLAVAEELERRPGSRRRRASDLAHHFERGGRPEKAYRYWLLAAKSARKGYAFAEAASAYRRAIEAADAAGVAVGGSLIERYGDACLQAGLYEPARLAFERRLGEAPRLEQRLELLRKLAEIDLLTDRMTSGVERLERVLAELGQPTRGAVWRILAIAADLLWTLGRRIAPRLVRARRLDRQARARSEVAIGVYTRLTQLSLPIDTGRSLYYLARQLKLAERLGPSRFLMQARTQWGLLLAFIGSRAASRREFELAASMEAEAGPAERASAKVMSAFAHACQGEVVDAEVQLQLAQPLAALQGEPEASRLVWIVNAHLALLQGNVGRARAMELLLEQHAAELGHRGVGAWALGLHAWAASLVGRWPEAAEAARAALAQLGRGEDLVRMDITSTLARALALSGHLKEAVPLLQQRMEGGLGGNVVQPFLPWDGWFLATAALARREGPLDPGLARQVRRARRFGRVLRRFLPLGSPAYEAGLASLAAAEGRQEVARAGFARAIALADRYGLAGERCWVHRFAARLLEGDAAETHRLEAAAFERGAHDELAAAPRAEAGREAA